MSQALTLQARIKVLIAKTFRAEKLFSSVHHSQVNQAVGAAALSEVANDIRTREWQKIHANLRLSLSEISKHSSSHSLVADLAALQRSFDDQVREAGEALDRGTATLVESAKKGEFAHVLKMSLELIRHRAKGQACRVIADELLAILENSGRKERSEHQLFFPENGKISSSWTDAAAEHNSSNVISLSDRRAVAGQRK